MADASSGYGDRWSIYANGEDLALQVIEVHENIDSDSRIVVLVERHICVAAELYAVVESVLYPSLIYEEIQVFLLRVGRNFLQVWRKSFYFNIWQRAKRARA